MELGVLHLDCNIIWTATPSGWEHHLDCNMLYSAEDELVIMKIEVVH